MASARTSENPFTPRRAASSSSLARCSSFSSIVVRIHPLYMHVHGWKSWLEPRVVGMGSGSVKLTHYRAEAIYRQQPPAGAKAYDDVGELRLGSVPQAGDRP